MKKIIFILTLFVTTLSFSQLFVSSGSSVYNKGNVVFVTQDIDIQSGGFIYLREEGQLLQGTSVASLNKGLGNLSVYQEGSADNYDYNYWCSPVGIPSLATTNGNFGVGMLGRPTTTTATTAAVILPSSIQNGIANPLQIASRWVYRFLSSSTYSNWFYSGTGSNIGPGEGFTMKGTSTSISDGGPDTTDVEANGVQNNPGGIGAQRYDFQGKPNNGEITVNVDAGKVTLTGNPYPSALNVNKFLLDAANTAFTGIAYYWESNKSVNSHLLTSYRGGYGYYSPISLLSNGMYVPATFDSYNGDGTLNGGGSSSGLIIERKYAPIGQGFMVLGNAPSSVTLKNSHREYYKESGALSQFERSSNELKSTDANNTVNPLDASGEQDVPHFRLNAIFNNQFTKQLALVLVPEATDGVDRGIDALSTRSSDLIDVYFVLDNNQYIIQGVNFDINKRIPLGIKSEANTTFKFYIPEVVNFDQNQMIYIYDGLDGSYHDVKNGTYEVTLSSGTFNSRFEITFLDSTLGLGGAIKSDFVIVQNNSNQMLTVSNPNLVAVKSVTLYDLTGKQIFSKEKLTPEESYQFSTSGLSDAVYLVELLTNDNRKWGQKIIISNGN